MKRTTAAGNDSNRYTEGNPALNIPATVVGGEEMNNLQEEIVNVVLDAGLTLDGGDENQLLEAINIIVANGGGSPASPGSPNISVSITDNVGATNVTGLDFDQADELAAYITYHLERRDAGQSAVETGVLVVYRDQENAAWEITQEVYTPASQTTPVGVTFTVTTLGQVQYASSNFGGASYVGTLKASVRTVQV